MFDSTARSLSPNCGGTGRAPARQDNMLETRTSLLERVRDREDQEAWNEFVGLYRPLLLGYVRSQDLQPVDAEDVVQSVLLALLRALPTFTLDRTRGRFRSWLWQITANALRDHHRRRASEQRTRQGYGRQAPPPVTTSDEPHEWVEAYRRRILEHVLQLVKAQTQERTWYCFEQHILHNRSGAEVGNELGMKPNTVCVNAARVLAKVRQRCAEYEEELADEDAPLSA